MVTAYVTCNEHKLDFKDAGDSLSVRNSSRDGWKYLGTNPYQRRRGNEKIGKEESTRNKNGLYREDVRDTRSETKHARVSNDGHTSA